MVRQKQHLFVTLSLALVFVMAIGTAAAAKVTLNIWDYQQKRLDQLKPYTDAYAELHPDVSFVLQATPNAEYWVKLPTAIAAGTPPEIAYFHNSFTSQFANVLEPFPEELFPLSKMRSDYFAFDQAFLLNAEDTCFYYLPMGIMTGVIFYNTDLWDNAGLAATPKTWAELRAAAKKLTIRDDNDTLQQAGLSLSSELWMIVVDMIYQQGGWLFSTDGRKAMLDTPLGRRALEEITDMLYVDRISNLPGDPSVDIRKGNVGMLYKWAWYRGSLDAVPGLRYSSFAVPTFTGSPMPALGRNNYESGLSVPKNQDQAHRKAAFEFLAWLYDQDSYLLEINVRGGRIPAKTSLWRKDEVRKDHLMMILANAAPHTVFPGELPNYQWEKPLIEMSKGILRQTAAPAALLEETQRVVNTRLSEEPATWVVERRYDPVR